MLSCVAKCYHIRSGAKDALVLLTAAAACDCFMYEYKCTYLLAYLNERINQRI